MGQKIHPLIYRIGFIKNWNSLWFADKHNFGKFVEEDARIRKFIKPRFRQASISKIVIERVSSGSVRIKIFAARPGVIIGRHGADIDRLKEALGKFVKREFVIDIIEVKKPSTDAQIIAQNVAYQLEKRVAYRRAVKRVIEQAMINGAKGIKVCCAGRLGGVEISRREKFKEGKIPLQTLRADIDYGFVEALTTFGLIGVKVWVYNGDIIGKGYQGSESDNKIKKPGVNKVREARE